MSETIVQTATAPRGLKARVLHEMREMAIIAGYLALFFFAFATQKMFLLHQFDGALFTYGAAIFKALVMAKVILIGQLLRLGGHLDDLPLLRVSVYKAFLYSLLVAAFSVVEDVVRGLIHGENFAGIFGKMGANSDYELALMALTAFCVFIPFFAIMETRRVMGEEEFQHLFLTRGK